MKITLKLAMTLAATITLGSAAASADTSALWNKYCASCHGHDGSGNTAMGRKAGAQDYRHAGVQASFSDSEAFAAIEGGVKRKGKVKMKGFGHKLSDSEIRALVTYVRHFRK